MIFLSIKMAAFKLNAYVYVTGSGHMFLVFPNAKSIFLSTTFKLNSWATANQLLIQIIRLGFLKHFLSIRNLFPAL